MLKNKRVNILKQHKGFIIFFILVIFIILELILHYLSDANIIRFPCLFHMVTGFYCPGCGMTRMVNALLELNFYQAFRYNMLGFLFTPFVLFYFIYSLIAWFKQAENKLLLKISEKTWYILVIITILFGILRNIEAFKFLAPTTIN